MVESQSHSDSKSHLIKQICDISNQHAISCSHHNNKFDSNPFVDWYILLQVEDNVGGDIIRKKYHNYALLLHPDKNKHPKAEFAFKLVSEAYACLSDEAKRLEFDVKRLKNLCTECMKKQQMRRKVSRSKKISARVKEVKARLMEEARVIEKCLKTNVNVNAFDKEMPIFDPDDYATHEGYPHFRVWRCNESKSTGLLKKICSYQMQKAKVKCDVSPIFECKSNRRFRHSSQQI